jgi:hypothetical protein
MNIAAIMPCRGRAEQTVANVRRLLATAGMPFQLTCIVDGDPEVAEALRPYLHPNDLVAFSTPGGYWRALEYGTVRSEATHLISLANDLWACDDWLRLAVEDYRAAFGDGDGLLGFAGDGHGERHSCHVLISRNLLDRYGGWPVWYRHNFGDRELCARAQQDGVYAKSARAWLEHCHPERGLADDDAVYQEGRATYKADEALFVERRRLGWPQA